MLNSIIKWVALCFTLAGAALTSFNVHPWNIYVLNIGAILYMWWAYRIREWNLVLVNFGILLIYVLGVLHHHEII